MFTVIFKNDRTNRQLKYDGVDEIETCTDNQGHEYFGVSGHSQNGTYDDEVDAAMFTSIILIPQAQTQEVY